MVTTIQAEYSYGTFVIRRDGYGEYIIIRAVDKGVVSMSKVTQVLEAWRNPPHEDFAPRTLWSLFNAFTEVFKLTSPLSIPTRSRALYSLSDDITSRYSGANA